jgi:hypothetical protein
MIIYGALFIPLFVAIFLYKKFNHKTVWWEFLIPLVVSLIFVISMKAIIETIQVSSTEYWGSIISKVEYYEDWDEWIEQTCTRKCCCDSKGENCSTETYDCSHKLYHPPYWQIITTNNVIFQITSDEFDRIKHKFKNVRFVELGRDYYRNDGDKYVSDWPMDSATAIPVTTSHNYENRIKVADQSVFHYGKVTKADKTKFDLKDYPKFNGYKLRAVLGDSSEIAQIGDAKFQYLNGKLGPKKKIRFFVLLFKNQPIEAALYQEWYWSGGNKNEFVICIGIDNDYKVKWCKPFSWSRVESLKTDAKSFVEQQQKLDLHAFADYIGAEANKKFVHRSFKEFSYLTVEPPFWAVLLTYFLTLAINVGLSYWIVVNEQVNRR